MDDHLHLHDINAQCTKVARRGTQVCPVHILIYDGQYCHMCQTSQHSVWKQQACNKDPSL